MISTYAGHWPAIIYITRRAIAIVNAMLHRSASPTQKQLEVSSALAAARFEPRDLSQEQLLEALLDSLSAGDRRVVAMLIGSEAAHLPQDGNPELTARRRLAARELVRRDLLKRHRGHTYMESPRLTAEWLRLHCAGLDHEVFLVLYLDVKHGLIAVEELFRGTLAEVRVYPREVIKQALSYGASALIFAHNHPLC